MLHSLFHRISIAATLIFVTSVKAEDTAKIGALLPLSGQLAPFGDLVRQGIEKADMKNARIIFEDDQCLPEKAVSAYKRLSSVDGVRLYLGPCCTSAVAAIAPLIKRDGGLAINFCTGSEEIFDRSGGSIFHAQYSAQTEAAFNAQAMWEQGVRHPIVIYQDSEFGRAHEHAFRAKFPGTVVSTLVYSGADREQMKALILKMKNVEFDAVYVPLVETFLLGLMTEMNKAGIKNKKAFGIYSVQLPAVLEAEGPHAEGIVYSYPEIPTDEDAAAYFAKCAAEMLGDGISKCGQDVVCIRRELPKAFNLDEHNFLQSRLYLKTIKNGAFVKYLDSSKH